jgi:hypothetical protein
MRGLPHGFVWSSRIFEKNSGGRITPAGEARIATHGWKMDGFQEAALTVCVA